MTQNALPADYTFSKTAAFTVGVHRKSLDIVANPVKNMVWYEVWYDKVRIYKGRNWQVANKTYNKIEF